MAESASGTVEDKTSSPNLKAPTDPEALALAVRMQIEYYFSKENLQTDTFLTSKMDSQKSVPIETVMGFSKLKALTTDRSVVEDALTNSSLVVLADGRIKSIVKSGRSTIILREISSDSSEEEIREIFDFPGCKPIASIRSEIGDFWFVTMESEEDAKDTLMDLKLKKRTFKGASVKARLKTETVIRSYYPAPAQMAGGYPMMPYAPYGSAPEGGAGFGGYANDGAAGNQGRGNRQGQNRRDQVDGSNDKSPGSRSFRDGDSAQGGGSPRRDGAKRSGGNGSSSGGKNGSRDRDGNGRKGSSQSGGKGHGKDRKDGEGSGKPPAPTPSIEINSSADFPPLPGDENGTGSPGGVPKSQSVLQTTFSAAAAAFTPAAEVIPPQGYQCDYTKYSIDDIMSIVTNIKEATLPSTIQAADHPCAMTTAPNTDLLLRQRTFSIDETREQMQQGRPVHREAAIAGAVDYGSLIYGEDEAATAAGGQKKKSGGGSWAAALMKGGDAPPPPPAQTAAPVKKTEPKAAAAAPTENKKAGGEGGGGGRGKKGGDGRGKGEKREKGSGGRERRNRSDSKGGDRDSGSQQPQSWGGRPTFANVLKEAEEKAAAEAAKTGGEAPRPTTSSGDKTATKSANIGSNGRSGQKNDKKPSGGSAPEGAWGREKLPPRP